MSYRYATVVQLTMDDPRNGHEEGDILLVAGNHPESYSYTVYGENDFVDVECDSLQVVGPSPSHMNKAEVQAWASGQPKAKEAAGLAVEGT